MTRTEMVTIVAARLNLTSATALARIADSVNEKYAEVLTAVGLPTSTRDTVSANTTIGDRFVTFDGVQRVRAVFDPNGAPGTTLVELTPDEMRNRPPRDTDPPLAYAVTTVDATSVTIWLDCTPATVYALSADVDADLSSLDADTAPVFPEKFHYMLIHGAAGLELLKMEKEDLADREEAAFQRRLGELRLFLAASAYKDIHQGKTGVDTFSTQLL